MHATSAADDRWPVWPVLVAGGVAGRPVRSIARSAGVSWAGLCAALRAGADTVTAVCLCEALGVDPGAVWPEWRPLDGDEDDVGDASDVLVGDRSVRLPIGPALDVLRSWGVEWPVAELADRVGVTRGTVHRWQHSGVDVWTADRVAVVLGRHPANVWPEWERGFLLGSCQRF